MDTGRQHVTTHSIVCAGGYNVIPPTPLASEVIMGVVEKEEGEGVRTVWKGMGRRGKGRWGRGGNRG